MKDHDKRPDPEILRMQEWFTAGWLTRREFMQGLLATGLTVTAASALVATTPDARAAMPKKGGKITFGWDQHGPADTLDPILFTSTIDYTRGRAGFNNLLQFNDDMTMRGELAEEWSVNDNATEFTFKIRKGVTFHDGKPLTADDVVYSMSRHLGEDSVSKANKLVSMISEWKKVDSHTVKAILATPNSDLPQNPRHLPLQDRAGRRRGEGRLLQPPGRDRTVQDHRVHARGALAARAQFRLLAGRPARRRARDLRDHRQRGPGQCADLRRHRHRGQHRSEGDQACRGDGGTWRSSRWSRAPPPTSWPWSTDRPPTTRTSCWGSSTCSPARSSCARC